MPADYDRIRAENITRYGTDTAVLDLLGQLYSDRTHFIFELIQNAEDAGATRLSFELSADRLVVRHDGRPFTEADVRGICGVAKSTKSGDLTAIGTFGIGFKAVYAYTQTPSVHSHDEHFRIENYVRPVAIAAAGDEPGHGLPGETLFVFPFDREDAPPATAVAEISAALAGLDPATLLFLRHIERLTVQGGGIGAARAGAAGQRHGRGGRRYRGPGPAAGPAAPLQHQARAPVPPAPVPPATVRPATVRPATVPPRTGWSGTGIWPGPASGQRSRSGSSPASTVRSSPRPHRPRWWCSSPRRRKPSSASGSRGRTGPHRPATTCPSTTRPTRPWPGRRPCCWPGSWRTCVTRAG